MKVKQRVNLASDQLVQGDSMDPNLFQKHKQSERISCPVTGRYFPNRKSKSKIHAESSTLLGYISNGASARLTCNLLPLSFHCDPNMNPRAHSL